MLNPPTERACWIAAVMEPGAYLKRRLTEPDGKDTRQLTRCDYL